MWPWGHLAVGYLAWTTVTRARRRRPPTGTETLALAVGTQFPDLVDKPLAWWFSVLPAGRSLAHSALTATLVVTVALVVFRRWDRPAVGPAVGVGYVSHLLGDAYYFLATGDWSTLAFLGWPLLPAPEYETRPSFLAHLGELGVEGLAALALTAALILGTAALSAVVDAFDRTFVVYVVGMAATSGVVYSALGLDPLGLALELVVTQVGFAVWVRDGTPGLPRRTRVGYAIRDL